MHYMPALPLFDVRNWVIVVTGATPEITQPLAAMLARTGAYVYVCQPCLDDGETVGRLGPTVIHMDHTDQASVANAVRAIQSRENHVNLLVNLSVESSISRRTSWDTFAKPTSQHSEVNDWDRVFGTNISSSYTLASAFGGLLRAGAECYGLGCAVNVSRPDTLTRTGYTTTPPSDAALSQLNTLLSTELNLSTQRPCRVRVNAVVLRDPAVTSCAVAQSVVSCAANSYMNRALISLE